MFLDWTPSWMSRWLGVLSDGLQLYLEKIQYWLLIYICISISMNREAVIISLAVVLAAVVALSYIQISTLE
ncbi:MAG: hypothetical protein ACK4M3_06410, partial [Pyrobaculum sp.]